ncbi:MAG: polysaccharide pyruvyl transferase family protein [Fimbriimonadaceae bacterium]
MATERILLLMDNRADSNWGSQATTSALVRLLSEAFPGAEVRGVPRSACRPENGIKRSLATALVQKGSRWALDALTRSWRQDFEWADLVVVNGEGTLHPQPQALRWVCSVTAMARLHKKPFWIVNCSLRCLGDKTEPLFAAFFREAEHVAAREPVSFREMKAIGADPVQAADCAWLTQPSSRDEALQIVGAAGVKGDFAVMTGSASVHKWPVAHQASVIEALRARGLEVLYTHSDRRDVENLAALGAGLPVVTHKEASFQQLTAIQSLAKIVVGGRFHPTILAALVGTPFVAVPSNTHKMAGLMEMLRASELLCDFSSLDKVVPTIKTVLDERDKWSAHLTARANEIARLAQKNVKT